jgi:hypothetical protein
MKVSSVIALVAVAAMSAGCTPDYAKQNQGDVIMLLVGFTPSDPFQSDVQNLKSGTVADEIGAEIAVRFKNPTLLPPQIPGAVILERYEVQYVRSDGRNVEGVDVPYRFSGNVTAGIDVATSGTTAISFELVRLQAKLEPPLSNLVNGGGANVLTCFANVTFYGRTVEGSVVRATGSQQVDFADYADK